MNFMEKKLTFERGMKKAEKLRQGVLLSSKVLCLTFEEL
ncbi:hypothetical protein LEP1GSC166_4132 [Leptospira kirschneri]|nr:hypothetical protein LEP1GSC166_4132 [Leptospira kirschneri]